MKLQDAQKGRESRPLTDSSSAYPRRRLSPERKGVHVSLKDMNMEDILGTGDADQKKEIENLKSKLKAVSWHCILGCTEMNGEGGGGGDVPISLSTLIFRLERQYPARLTISWARGSCKGQCFTVVLSNYALELRQRSHPRLE